ncbi:glutathione S-transferase C-terminal domain-containing protein [Nonomuraea sp. K274]|uniref:Glutathione S-transferase C-terminal domain-containing protein n=1 Tax=Nonomuraea cypriaca TaxID=1187855 RepID=A0A931EXY6_9ACTN|nr:glutathione S-transferase C-terminal domain-containing protein [Nonomuraea cypriaca]MBF8186755.1 glutathione S-transferase C-terminal domain-containing protein [Nonomuraea cypriaca]
MRPSREISDDGRFVRRQNRFTERLGPPEPGRYRVYASYACPWAQRVLIVRALLGLEDLLDVTIVDPIRDEKGWRIPGGDPEYLSELYHATDPGYTGRYTVPCVWDTRDKRIVTNDFPQITLDLEMSWGSAPNLYPERLRPDVDIMNDRLYHGLNNAVYEAGFSRSQQSYEEAVARVFTTLDFLEVRLAESEFLFDTLTESDVRLYTTLARFDSVYYAHFKCSVRRLIDYPALWAYARRLYAIPAFRDTTDFDHIKRHYYATQTNINPSRIVPVGPELDWSL